MLDIAPRSVNPDSEAGQSLGGGGARNLASEVISTAVSPKPVARESGLGGGGGGGDHGAVVGSERSRGYTAAFRALHDDFSIPSSLKALLKNHSKCNAKCES